MGEEMEKSINTLIQADGDFCKPSVEGITCWTFFIHYIISMALGLCRLLWAGIVLRCYTREKIRSPDVNMSVCWLQRVSGLLQTGAQWKTSFICKDTETVKAKKKRDFLCYWSIWSKTTNTWVDSVGPDLAPLWDAGTISGRESP